MTRKMPRRTFLRTAAGTAIALPALEAMWGPSNARAKDGVPCRFLVAFGGVSVGRDGTDNIVPDIVGADYDLKGAIAPLGDYDVQGDVTVVSNLLTPWGTDPMGSDVPPAGRLPMMHNSCFVPLFCGTRPAGLQRITAASSDQLVGEAIGGGTNVPTMAYRVQAVTEGAHPEESGMSSRIGPTGQVELVTPKISPELIFQELFDGFAAPGDDPAAVAAAEYAKRRRLSVLDFVGDSVRDLSNRVSAADRIRVERHLDYVRELEQRVQSITPGEAGEGCYVPAEPTDPPISETGYSDEDTRADLIVELIALAFACDISRSGSLMFTTPQCGMHLQPFTGTDESLHTIGHNSDDPGQPGQRLEQMTQYVAWHVKHFARLVSLLAAAPEVDGSSVLDHSALVLVFEGGHGFDPMGGGEVHSTENMSALIAGRAGGLSAGRHVTTNEAHPSSVILSGMRAVGYDGAFGEVTDDIPALFG